MSMLLVALMAAPLLQAPATELVGDPQKGAAVYRQKMCGNCHGPDGEGAFGPDLAGARGLTLEQFKHPIRQPWGVMLAYTEKQLPDQGIADMYAFLKTKPKPKELGHWHWPAAPASAPYTQRVYMQIVGCSQCHEPENKFGRKWMGEQGKNATFEYFKKVIYTHTDKYPTGNMGNYSPDRLSEGNLREIYKFYVEELGLRASIGGGMTIGDQKDGNTTYKIALNNPGVKDVGLAAEGVTVFIRVPAGTKVVGGTGPGYKGSQSFQSLGLVPALQLAPHPDEQGRTIRPDYDKSGDAVVWKLPKIAAQDKVELTFTLAGAPSADLVKAMDGSAVHWEKPGRTAFGKKLTYYDLRTPDSGDHERLAPPRLP
ncbi:MAG: c-type cytochrome [Vicinamibacterales bacterium]